MNGRPTEMNDPDGLQPSTLTDAPGAGPSQTGQNSQVEPHREGARDRDNSPRGSADSEPPPRRRDSVIPLPEGFRPRQAPGVGLPFGAPEPAATSAELGGERGPDSKPASIPPPRSARSALPSAAPKLILSPIDAPRLIYERDHEPSDQSPILYRECAYVVDPLQSDEELEEQLQAELLAIQHDWRDRDASQFVQLALFDHVFEGEPKAPALATLSWKDWHGRSEVWVRGVRRSTAPPPDALDDEAAQSAVQVHSQSDDADDFDDLEDTDKPEPVEDTAEDDDAEPIPLLARHKAGAGSSERAPDSGTSWPVPGRSGQYPVVSAEDAPLPPPSSQRVLVGDELIGALFERMHELDELPDVTAAAGFVLATLEELIPSDAALVHVFDIDTRQFLLVGALGPGSMDLPLLRTLGVGLHLEEALRQKKTLSLPSRDGSHAIWRALGLRIEWALCSPVHHNGRFLGAIELAREALDDNFSAGQIQALEYVCEQFAEFVMRHPLEPAPDSSSASEFE
jgi:GAF domain-containing protein